MAEIRVNAYAVAMAASIAKIIAIVNAAMIITPTLALALAKEPRGVWQEHHDSKVFEIKFSKFQIR